MSFQCFTIIYNRRISHNEPLSYYPYPGSSCSNAYLPLSSHSVWSYKKADQLAVWSGESLKDAIPSDKSTEYETAWEAYQPGLTADNWESYTEQTSMATAVCASGAEAFPMFEKNGVSLEAYPGLVYEQVKK